MDMNYLPNTKEDRQKMLEAIGVSSVEDLFADLPQDVRLGRPLDLPAGLSELELGRLMRELSEKNGDLNHYTSFLGAGVYDRFTPSVVEHVLSRAEFYTAYTPYQPEISQGVLQSIYEYQSMICELTGMDVSNASMYDGASALAEAGLMCATSTGRRKLVVSRLVHPEYRKVLATYARGVDLEIVEVSFQEGRTDLEDLKGKVDDQTAGVLIQNPNFLGNLEEVQVIEAAAHGKGSLLVVAVDPISLGLLAPPGAYGADIVVGDGQSLGNPISFGGPHLGFLAVRERLVRRMPGRIVGATLDNRGQRGFVLTLTAREQHIRRERATSNICSNQALNALAVTVYLSLLGKGGLKEVANQSLQKAHYAHQALSRLERFQPAFSAPFFQEFAVRTTLEPDEVNRELLKHRIIGGYDLGRDYPELKNHLLLAFTEKRSKEEIDYFVARLEGLL
ncbi:MAG: aminomethyl-transferring glycine dehydrogenase subunit GcvPA [Firmicutes bacterium]|nr:aminomethyl-transferring glycine dehydrogenase subunit GcvPA [Bacillota bacterium]